MGRHRLCTNHTINAAGDKLVEEFDATAFTYHHFSPVHTVYFYFIVDIACSYYILKIAFNESLFCRRSPKFKPFAFNFLIVSPLDVTTNDLTQLRLLAVPILDGDASSDFDSIQIIASRTTAMSFNF